jgi:hypothetical protein
MPPPDEPPGMLGGDMPPPEEPPGDGMPPPDEPPPGRLTPPVPELPESDPLLPPLTDAQPVTRKAAAAMAMQALGNDVGKQFEWFWRIFSASLDRTAAKIAAFALYILGLSLVRALCSVSMTIIRATKTINSQALDNVNRPRASAS